MMKDDETFDLFYAKLNDLVHYSFNISEKLYNSKTVWKILRPLPKRFRPKVTVIENSKDLNSKKVDELVRSLQTYELSLLQSKKMNFLAFTAFVKSVGGSNEYASLGLRESSQDCNTPAFRGVQNSPAPANPPRPAPTRPVNNGYKTFLKKCGL
jgi:hypothetical protein